MFRTGIPLDVVRQPPGSVRDNCLGILMGVRRSGGIARSIPLDDVDLCPGGPQLEDLPSKTMRGSSDTPKTRSLPWSTDATRAHLSFFARVSGFMGVLSCDITICSGFLDGLVTSRDRECLLALRPACR